MRGIIHGCKQQALIDLKLTNDDALILNWFMVFHNRPSMIKLDDHGLLIKSKLQADLPTLNNKSNSTLERRFKKYMELGLWTNRTSSGVGSGTLNYFRPTEKFYNDVDVSTGYVAGKKSKKGERVDRTEISDEDKKWDMK